MNSAIRLSLVGLPASVQGSLSLAQMSIGCETVDMQWMQLLSLLRCFVQASG